MTELDRILSNLDFQLTHLTEIANIDPDQAIGREAALYRALTRLQLVVSRFVVVPAPANDSSFDAQLSRLDDALNADGAA